MHPLTTPPNLVFRLRLLGTPHLEAPTGIVPQGPRRVAILAALAAAGPGGLTRDKLVTLLWPDADDDRAKRNLSQLLYAMRTELGVDLVEGTGSLRVATAACTADVMEFDAAVAARQDADVVRIYTGAFLDGFHLAESSAFSQWADGERDRRLAQVRAAASRIAKAAEGTAEATTAYRKALSLDPLSAPLALKLIDAFVAAGDRTAALRVAEQHAALVRSELDTEGDPAVAARAAEIRRLNGIAKPVSSPAETPAASAGSTAQTESTATDADPAPRRIPVQRVARRRPLLIGAGAALAAAALVAVGAWKSRAAAPLAENEFVLIAQFENATNDTLLNRTLGAAMAAALQQSAFVVPLPRGRVTAAMRRMARRDSTEFLPLAVAREVAEREGVRFVIAGELLTVGTSRQLVARIIEAPSGRVMAAHTFTVTDDAALLAAIGDASRRIRHDLGEARSSVRTMRPLPEVTTSSLAALHEYALGLDAERANRAEVARAYYRRAIEFDSGFAAVHAKLAEIHAFNNNVPASTFHADRATALAEGLPLAEKLRIMMSVAWARGDREAMVAYGRTYVDLRPRDFAAWARLGFTLFSAGQHTEARAAYATADRISPLSAVSVLNWGTSWLSDARQGAVRVHFDSARHYYERAFRADSTAEYDTFYNHQYGTILLGAGLPDSARATFERMQRRSYLDRARALRSLAYLDAYLGDWTLVADRISQAADIGVREKQWTTAARNETLVAETYITLGDRARAAAPLARATAIAIREPLEARMIAFTALAQVRAGELGTARRLRDRMRELARPEHDAEQAALSYVDGAIALASGNASRAQESIEAGFRRDPGNPQGRVLRARALEAAGRDTDALKAWDEIAAIFDFGAEGQFEWQFADAERARLLERLGRLEEAATALRRLVARYPARADSIDPPVLQEARERLKRLEGSKPRN